MKEYVYNDLRRTKMDKLMRVICVLSIVFAIASSSFAEEIYIGGKGDSGAGGRYQPHTKFQKRHIYDGNCETFRKWGCEICVEKKEGGCWWVEIDCKKPFYGTGGCEEPVSCYYISKLKAMFVLTEIDEDKVSVQLASYSPKSDADLSSLRPGDKFYYDDREWEVGFIDLSKYHGGLIMNIGYGSGSGLFAVGEARDYKGYQIKVLSIREEDRLGFVAHITID
jgi:hypothetical protein